MRLPMIFAAAAISLAGCGTPEVAAPAVEVAAAEAPQTEQESAGETGMPHDTEERPVAYALAGRKLPAFTAPLSTGDTFNSAEIYRWTVIHVWGVWCSDSRADGPYTTALERALAQDPDVDFVSVHVPQNADKIATEEMFARHGSLEAYFDSAGYSFPVVLDQDASIRAALQITWTPSYLLVSPDGVVRGFRTDLSVAGGEPVKDFIRDIARVRGEVRAGTHLRIGPQGVAGLSGTTPFTLQSIEAAFPGFTVTSITEGPEAAIVFKVLAPDSSETRFTVQSDWSRGYIGRVSTVDQKIKGALGETIGTSTLSELPEALRGACAAADASGAIRCPETGASGTFVRTYAADTGLLTGLDYLPAVPSP